MLTASKPADRVPSSAGADRLTAYSTPATWSNNRIRAPRPRRYTPLSRQNKSSHPHWANPAGLIRARQTASNFLLFSPSHLRTFTLFSHLLGSPPCLVKKPSPSPTIPLIGPESQFFLSHVHTFSRSHRDPSPGTREPGPDLPTPPCLVKNAQPPAPESTQSRSPTSQLRNPHSANPSTPPRFAKKTCYPPDQTLDSKPQTLSILTRVPSPGSRIPIFSPSPAWQPAKLYSQKGHRFCGTYCPAWCST